MNDYLPILIVGAIIGVFTLIFLIAYLTMKDKKDSPTNSAIMMASRVMRCAVK